MFLLYSRRREKFSSQANVEKFNVDLEKSNVSLWLKQGGDVSDETIKQPISDAGYDVETISRLQTTPKSEPQSKVRAAKRTKLRFTFPFHQRRIMPHPDHSPEINRINRIQGQLEGIKKMIAEKRYCIDILNQTKAVSSALHSLESALLEKHLHHCISMTFSNTNNQEEREKKLQEVLNLFRKRMK